MANFALAGAAQADAPTKMYWTEQQASVIKRANVAGTSIETLVTGASSASGLSLDGSKLYWTQTSGGLIKRANLDGNSIETLVGGLTFPFGILLEPSGKM